MTLAAGALARRLSRPIQGTLALRWPGRVSGRGSKLHRRLNKHKWARVRLQVFERDGWRCCICGGAGGLECDHIIAQHRGGDPYQLNNLQTLCRACHIIEKSRGERERPDPGRAAWRALLRSFSSA